MLARRSPLNVQHITSDQRPGDGPPAHAASQQCREWLSAHQIVGESQAISRMGAQV